MISQKINLRSGLKGDLIELDGARIQILHPVREQVETVFGSSSQDTPLGITDDRGIPLEQLMERPKVFRAERYILCADGRRHPSKQTVAKLLSWYGDVEIVSPQNWWSDGYFSAADIKQFIESKRLRVTMGKGVPSCDWGSLHR